MATIKIAVINATSDVVLSDAEAAPAVNALQEQVTSDFAPVWGTDADLTFVPRGQTPLHQLGRGGLACSIARTKPMRSVTMT